LAKELYEPPLGTDQQAAAPAPAPAHKTSTENMKHEEIVAAAKDAIQRGDVVPHYNPSFAHAIVGGDKFDRRDYFSSQSRAAWEARSLRFLVDGNAKLLDGTYVAGWVLFQQTVRKAIDKAEKGIRLNEMERSYFVGASENAIKLATQSAKHCEKLALEELRELKHSRATEATAPRYVVRFSSDHELSFSGKHEHAPERRDSFKEKNKAGGKKVSLPPLTTSERSSERLSGASNNGSASGPPPTEQQPRRASKTHEFLASLSPSSHKDSSHGSLSC